MHLAFIEIKERGERREAVGLKAQVTPGVLTSIEGGVFVAKEREAVFQELGLDEFKIASFAKLKDVQVDILEDLSNLANKVRIVDTGTPRIVQYADSFSPGGPQFFIAKTENKAWVNAEVPLKGLGGAEF